MSRALTLYGQDHGDIRLYKLNKEQFDELLEKEDWDTIEKFAVSTNTLGCGYVPGWALTLAEMFDLNVDSI